MKATISIFDAVTRDASKQKKDYLKTFGAVYLTVSETSNYSY